ncbi:STING domain-containing protein [Ruegeria sp. HKCCA6707]|uniref:STING domain-containing protein n=1 Tax=Ruegeria sp. HKCCA6707 TaxID=2682996 RepID=UPI001487E2FA|nr:STING domain-containing protein [Ruegeria sp. HKCCA6707]
MRPLKIFVVGPHEPERYRAIKLYVERFVSRAQGEHEVDVVTPIDNPTTDRFNDWIFGQIDTCDLIIADMTGFNPNVVYEVAFAHTLGTPCIYLQFGQDESDRETALQISHYFKFSLMAEADEASLYSEIDAADLETGRVDSLDRSLSLFLNESSISGETIISEYYGAFPADAEFMRGLAESYYRNYLGFILEARPPEEFKDLDFKIVVPDTFEVTDADINRVKDDKLPSKYTIFPQALNSMERALGVSRHSNEKAEFFYDIPTIILTVTLSSKYKKIADSAYFSSVDRDALTDRLARKFVSAIWDSIRDHRRSIRFPTKQLHFVWLSELTGYWHDDVALMNDVPFDRPDGF